jgi:Salmonella virulence plasmid 65kDa B protein
MPLASVPGRAGVSPALSLIYDSAGGDGVLGMGFSLSGASAITRCPSNLADDGEIRAVHNDVDDKLCLDGKRLIKEGSAPGTVSYHTFPDTLVKVVFHFSHGEDAKEGARTRSPTRRRLAHRFGRASSRRRIRGFEQLSAEVRAVMVDDLVCQGSCAGRSEDDVRRLLRPRGTEPAGESTALTAIDPPCRLRAVDGDAVDFKEAL